VNTSRRPAGRYRHRGSGLRRVEHWRGTDAALADRRAWGQRRAVRGGRL